MRGAAGDAGRVSNTKQAGEATGWVAWILFGGLMLLLLGGAHLTVGSLALVRPEALAGSRSDLLLDVGLILGRVWARVAAIVLACVAVLVNFAYAELYPVGAVVTIGLNVVVLYATVAHGRELTAAYHHG